MSNELQKVEKVAGGQQGAILAAPTAADIIMDEPNEKEKEYFHFGKPVKVGSRKVNIKLVPKFSILPSEPAAKFIRDEVTKKIGSTWKRGTRDILRAIEGVEESYYLPDLMGIRVDSEQWNGKSREFWANFNIEIPNDETGIILEIGFKEVEPFEFKGKLTNTKPINIDDYLKYNHALQHKDVASSPEQLDNMFIYTFQMIDEGIEAEKKEQAFTIRSRANKLFNRLIDSKDSKDQNKIDWILETVGGKEGKGINIEGLTSTQKQMELEATKDLSPSRFIEIVEDVHLETKALIRKAVSYGQLIQDGNSYFLDNKVIGSTLQQAIGYLTNPANQKDKFLVIERLKAIRGNG